jgi:hypothetical protein
MSVNSPLGETCSGMVTAYLLMDVELPEDLSGIQKMSVLEDPIIHVSNMHARRLGSGIGYVTYFLAFQMTSGRFRIRASQ